MASSRAEPLFSRREGSPAPTGLVAAEKALPFDLKVPNATTVAAMKEARAGGLASFNNVSDLMADLNAED
jgi:hypothetical protein